VITGPITDPIDPTVLPNTPIYIFFEGSSTPKQNIRYNNNFCSKKLPDHELPAPTYVLNKLLYLFRHIRQRRPIMIQHFF